jgi:hypothetical protein
MLRPKVRGFCPFNDKNLFCDLNLFSQLVSNHRCFDKHGKYKNQTKFRKHLEECLPKIIIIGYPGGDSILLLLL